MIKESLVKKIPVDAPMIVCTKDVNSTYTWSNAMAARVVGLTAPEAIVSLTDFDLKLALPDELITQFIANDQSALAGQSIIFIEETCWDYFGHLKVISTKMPMVDENNRICGVFCSSVPIRDESFLDFIKQIEKDCIDALGKKQENVQIVDRDTKHHLTLVELEVLFFTLRQKSIRCIADLLNLTVHKVSSLLSKIKIKFDCATHAQLIEKAILDGYHNLLPSSFYKKYLFTSFTGINGRNRIIY